MSTQQVTITYSAPLVFLSTDHWKQIYASLLSQLPLRNLHWKPTSRNALRSIQELDVRVVSLDTLREDQAASQVPRTVLDKPLLNLYICICEDSEAYRATTRKQIKDWHASISQRKNQEWLIVHVVRPDQSIAQARLFQMKTSVLDKVKADFNTDKKDRCVQLVWSADRDHPTVWADLVTKLKEGVLAAFDAAVTQREEEVRRSEGQKQMPGWNFCTFFILKESVANSLEGMKLYEDALQEYYDLETTFFQVLREKNLSWFGPLITPTPTDDSAPLLSISKKAYRDLILANTISVFDFRVYLLARQCMLLSKTGDMEQLCRKAAAFLNTFARTLREVEVTLPAFFIESWIYSSALSVTDQSDEWARSMQIDNPSLAAFSAAKGELVELARHQLDVLGIVSDFLPKKPPFSLALSSAFDLASKDIKAKRNAVSITNTELLSALEDQDTFYDLYVSITNRAIELYTSAGRRKFAVKLHGTLAALDVHRGRLDNALQTFTSLPAHYSPHGWTSLEGFMLSRALNIHAALEKPNDREWIHILIHFLKAYVGDMGKDLLLGEEENRAYIQRLVTSLKDAANELDSDRPCPDHPAFSVLLVEQDAKLAGTRDGSLLKVRVLNKLPCDFPAEMVEIQLSGRENSRISFTTTVSKLTPGFNDLTLFCPSSAAGTYSLISSHIRMSRLLFEWSHNPKAKQTRVKTLPKLVRVPRDLRALDVRLKQPPIIELGTPSKVMVHLSTGRNAIATAKVKLDAPTGVQFEYTNTELIGDDSPPFRTDEDSITLLDLTEGQVVIAAVPHSDASANPYMRVNIAAEYVTSAEPKITRTLSLSRTVASSLPIGINVEDFFRGTRLFTAFTLSTKSHQHIRVRSAQLISQSEATGVRVTSCIAQKPGVVTLTPSQSGKFLFQMDSQRGQAHEGLKLRISYRVFREEVESVIDLAVSEVISQTPSLESVRHDVTDKFVQVLEADASWVELYNVSGEIIVPGIVPSEEDEMGSALRRVSEKLNKTRTPTSFGEWRDIIIPVDVPQKHILASARLQILDNPFSATVTKAEKPRRPLYAGQPISALLTIQTSFHWAPPEDTEVQSYMMRYDIEDLMHDWLVSGRKRGDFVAKDGGAFTTPVTLIALHHGELVLPRIGVTALPVPGDNRMRSSVVPSCETHQVHGAERVLVLPRGGRSTFVVNMGTSTSI